MIVVDGAECLTKSNTVTISLPLEIIRVKPKTSRTPVFPAEWQNQFGLPVEEHRRMLQVNIFEGYTIFGIKDKPTALSLDVPEGQDGRKDEEI